MRLFVASAVLLAAGLVPAFAQGPEVDPRAFNACQEESENFTEIPECLRFAHVAVTSLDAFEEIYGPEAQPLKARCIEINPTVQGAYSCVIDAAYSAVEVAQNMPAGTTIDDPIFEAVRDPEAYQRLRQVEADQKALWPNAGWGGMPYFPYR
jgi:hypothetical protein